MLPVVFLGVAVRPSTAQIFESVGERALGMGGAFVAVSDDATATYWNPAGLATGAIADACLFRATTRAPGGGAPATGAFGEGSSATSMCLAVPAIGFSFYHLRATRAWTGPSPTGTVAGSRQDLRLQGVGVSSLLTRQVGVTFVQSVVRGLTVGATVKYVRGRVSSGTAPAGTGTQAALDLAGGLEDGAPRGVLDADLGVMAAGGPLKAGLTVRNVGAPRFGTGAEAQQLVRQVRVGVALTPGHEATTAASEDALVLAADLDLTRTPTPAGERRMAAVGAERWVLGRRFGIRVGARVSTVGEKRAAGSLGTSVAVRRGMFLEAHVVRGGSQADRGWGLGARVGF